MRTNAGLTILMTLPPLPPPQPQYTGACGNPFVILHGNIPLLIRAKMKLSGHPSWGWGWVEGASAEEHLTGHPEVDGSVPATVTRETQVFLRQNDVLTRYPSALPTCVYARTERIMYACQRSCGPRPEFDGF